MKASMLIEDTGQKEGKHTKKHDIWNNQGIGIFRAPLPVGDYVKSNDKIIDVVLRKDARGIAVKKMDFAGCYDRAVDTKKDIQEIIGNICGRQHQRFRDELILAEQLGIKLLVLVENEDGVETMDDLEKWENPRKRYSKGATSGETLVKAMKTMVERYKVEFWFCKPEEAADLVMNWLEPERIYQKTAKHKSIRNFIDKSHYV